MARAEAFPTTPRARRSLRAGAIAMGLVAVGLACRTTITSTAWVGRSFPGFMVLDNGVVASVSLPDWSGVRNQSQVVSMDGRPVPSTAALYAYVESLPVGTRVHYRLRRDGRDVEVVVPTQRFGLRDWMFLFGPFLLNGVTYVAAAIVVWVLRPGPLGWAFVASAVAWAFFLLTAMDLYGPATFFRLHVVAESLVPPAVLQLAFVFPQPHRWARWRFAQYALAAVVVTLYELFLYRPAVYSRLLGFNMALLGLACFALAARLVSEYRPGSSPLARQRVRVVTLGVLLGLALPGAIAFASAVFRGEVAVNLGTVTPIVFALAVAYAIVKHDLFEIDAMVKRGAYYLLLTGAVGAGYAAGLVLFNWALPGSITGSAVFPVLFTLAVLMLFNPLRTFLQGVVDRVFFRTTYDSAQVLEVIGAELASALTRSHIGRLVRGAVDGAIPNARTRLFVGSPTDGWCEVDGDTALPQVLAPCLSPGRVLTAFESAESLPDAPTAERVREALGGIEAEVAVPLWLRGELVGVLTAGPKRSGLFYTAGDAAFLRALAHQAAIALQNAESYEELMALNAGLEERVAERTAQLEASNRELSATLRDLRQTQVQLVQSEKMASLGRLVAGVAHEINNPVSFIATSVSPLRRRLERAAAAAPPEMQRLLSEADEIVGIMERGAERTTAIVQDLRSFSRLGEATRKPVDLHEGIDTTLRLLEARWRDRITIHRDYGDLPPVECDPGQLNQVFMNVLANACDAIGSSGNIWITTRVDGELADVAIRDDGPGIPPDVMDHVFDPFFTTKDVGGGTGLGLAISHQVVTAHGGTIDLETAQGTGTTVRIRMPIQQARSLDSVANAGR
ncbi:MAG TPA: ATP-binding protein [Candidatus Binatia bacterium]|nr:ATP-binding protein [Candidatus Binatia bacterium]